MHWLVMSGQLKRQEVNNLIAEEIETYARANGYNLQNRILRETSDGLIRATNNTNFYFGSYYHSRAFNAGADAFHDSSILRSHAGSASEGYINLHLIRSFSHGVRHLTLLICFSTALVRAWIHILVL